MSDLTRKVMAPLDQARRTIPLGGVPWSCDVCGEPGRKANGPEGYCAKHWPSVAALLQGDDEHPGDHANDEGGAADPDDGPPPGA